MCTVNTTVNRIDKSFTFIELAYSGAVEAYHNKINK
jgi:hypothetical protein